MGISAKIIADSVSPSGKRITTFELEYHRYVHSENLTHRLFSRNSSSSRAIPVEKMIEHIENNTAMPIHWGKNQAGMQAKTEQNQAVWVTETSKHGHPESWTSREGAWYVARNNAIELARRFLQAGYHKQIVNRLTEPFQMIKVILTATEFENFFWLRDDEDAQPEIRELARKMIEARSQSVPRVLKSGEWHVPYYLDGVWNSESPDSLEDALSISASSCAQVSYRKLDKSLEKARDIYQKLISGSRCHSSPLEHQATPMPDDQDLSQVPGVTHYHFVTKQYGSGNFFGWIQHRQLLTQKHTVW